MTEEVSPESKLYVKEEIEKSRKEFKDDLEKAQSRATRTFTTIGMIVGLLTALGVYGIAAKYIDDTIKEKLDVKTLKEFEENKIKAEQNMNEAEGILEEILRLKKIANLPVGTIVASMLEPSKFAEAVGDPNRKINEWQLADGKPIAATSRYGQLSGKTKTPDLRGMFLRGMNEGRKDGKQDPEQNRTAGHYQSDALQEHGHVTDATEWNWNKQGNAGYTSQAKNAPSSSVRNVTGANVEVETRPKNVAVYFYIKIN